MSYGLASCSSVYFLTSFGLAMLPTRIGLLCLVTRWSVPRFYIFTGRDLILPCPLTRGEYIFNETPLANLRDKRSFNSGQYERHRFAIDTGAVLHPTFQICNGFLLQSVHPPACSPHPIPLHYDYPPVFVLPLSQYNFQPIFSG